MNLLISWHRFYPAPFLSATIVLSTIPHRCSTSRTCTLVAVRYYSISELAPCRKKKKIQKTHLS